MTTQTFYSNKQHSAGSGYLEAWYPNSIWAVLRAKTVATSKSGTSGYINLRIVSGSTTDKWGMLTRGLVCFDTTDLPVGSTIISATVKLYCSMKEDVFNEASAVALCGVTLTTTIYPLTLADFNDFGDTLFSDYQSYPGITVGDWLTLTLTAAGLANIVPGGLSKFGVREQSYDISDSPPDWQATSEIEYGFAGCGWAGAEPQLIIVYTAPGTAPDVQTDPATLVTGSTATLNGTLVDDGGAVTTVNFEYGISEAFGAETAGEVKTTGQTFFKALTGLIPNTKYYFRAKAVSSGGLDYGAILYFLTLGSTFPTVGRSRVSGLVHRLSPGNYSLDVLIGGLSSYYTSPVVPLKPQPTIPPTPPPALPPSQPPPLIPDTSLGAYARWLGARTQAQIFAIFGHYPYYSEWIAYILGGGV